MSRYRQGLLELGLGAGLAAVTLLVYYPSFDYPFVDYDDAGYVYQNGHVQSGLTVGGVRWAFTTFACGNWHPLTWLSLQLDATLWGGTNSGAFHRTNVLLHALNAALLLLVLARMTGRAGRSAAAAGLFALHPLRVESVAWVSERKDVLSALFWVLALAAYLHYARRPGLRRYLAVAAALALGLLAKPMLVTLPCVLLLLDHWPLARRPATPLRRLVLEKAPLFALAAASSAVTVAAQAHVGAVTTLEEHSPAVRVANALLAYVSYLGQTLWPARLAVYYPHPGPEVSWTWAVAAGLFLVAVTLLVLGPGRRWPYLAVGWLWYVGTLVPVIGLVQVGSQAMADRYTYLPLVGVFLALTWGAADLAAAWRLPRAYPAVAASLVLAACAVRTRVQLGHWDSSVHLWERAASVSEADATVRMYLGNAYYARGMLSEARREFEQALALDPRAAEAHVNLGMVLADLGRWDRAEAEYRKALDLAPELPAAHLNLGDALARAGRHREALAEYRRAVSLDPGKAAAHNNLASLLWDLGRPAEAVEEYGKALDLDPRFVPSRVNLGRLHAELRQPDEALAQYREAVALAPESAEVHHYLGDLLWDLGRLEEGLAEYRRARDLGDRTAGPRLRTCQRLRALRSRLAGLTAGRDPPADNAERLAFAELCRQPFEGRYAQSARLYRDALDADPGLADDPRTATRFRAACAAAAAGCGRDRGADAPGAAEKARLRRQALAWLRDDLNYWATRARSDRPEARAEALRVLMSWLRDPDLRGVRGPDGLTDLPEAERAEWRDLWQEVEAARARAGGTRTREGGEASGERPRPMRSSGA